MAYKLLTDITLISGYRYETIHSLREIIDSVKSKTFMRMLVQDGSNLTEVTIATNHIMEIREINLQMS